MAAAASATENYGCGSLCWATKRKGLVDRSRLKTLPAPVFGDRNKTGHEIPQCGRISAKILLRRRRLVGFMNQNRHRILSFPGASNG
eukprot:scaffold10690_cov126-Cylindrotheca_fusiformis.AAC.4